MNNHIIEFNDVPLTKITDKFDRNLVENISKFARLINYPAFECVSFDVLLEDRKYVIICDYPEDAVFDQDSVNRIFTINMLYVQKILILKHDKYMRLEVHVQKSTEPLFEEIETIEIKISRKKILTRKAIQYVYEYDDDDEPEGNKAPMKPNGSNKKIKKEYNQ